MWQIEYLIGLIPIEVLNNIYSIIIAVGITGILASKLGRWIPFYGNYAKILKPIGIILLAVGLYGKGVYHTEKVWREKVKDAEAKVKAAEKNSEQLAEDLAREREKKQEVRVKYYEKVKKEIVEIAVPIDKECKLDPRVNQILNKAAANPGSKK